jgi:hypothetical protein
MPGKMPPDAVGKIEGFVVPRSRSTSAGARITFAVLLGAASGRLVDVDLDSAEAVELAQGILSVRKVMEVVEMQNRGNAHKMFRGAQRQGYLICVREAQGRQKAGEYRFQVRGT